MANEMPELPDVENFKKYMNSTSLHKQISSVEVKSSKILESISSGELKKHLKGKKFKSTKRYGKNLFAKTSNKEWLRMHFGMTGFLKYYKDESEAPGHTRLLINFSNGYHLAYDCSRKLGKIDIVDNIDSFIEKKKLGADPLEDNLSSKRFKKLISKRTGTVKSFLMNQKIIAGIGNVYSDEILFQAGIHPASLLNKLKKADIKNLYKKMNTVLKKAISANADPEKLGSKYLLPNRENETMCPKCSGKIKKKTIAGRSSYFCSKHQKKK